MPSRERPRATQRSAGEPREPAVLDASDLLDRFGGAWPLVRQVVELFLEESPAMLAAVRAALDARDDDALAYAAHKIRGAVASLSGARARDAAARLERLGETRDPGNREPAYERLAAELGSLESSLRDLIAKRG